MSRNIGMSERIKTNFDHVITQTYGKHTT